MTEDDPGCPCGGTHVGHVSDIEQIYISKIAKKGKSIQVKYEVLRRDEKPNIVEEPVSSKANNKKPQTQKEPKAQKEPKG